MPQEILSKETKAVLEILKNNKVLEDFYLAGGTGLAIRLEHRLSLDLDFFSKKDIATGPLIQKLKKLGRFALQKQDENTVSGRLNGVWITFLKYDYPCLFSLKPFQGIKIADIRDIGCMKIAAVSSRGTKKDFIDVYFVCQRIMSLKKLLELFKKKYQEIDYNMMHILKSLVYFRDAQRDPMPKMIISVSWQDVKDFFRKELIQIEKK